MTNDRFAHHLERLDIPADRAEALALMPVCYVAWADGPPSRRVAWRVHRLAQHLLHGSQAEVRAVVAPWLVAPPAPETVSEACDVLRRLAAAPDEHNVTFVELAALPCYAEWVARANGRRVDAPRAVTPSQARALQQLGAWLAVDVGEPWAVVIEELEPSTAAA